MQALTYVFVRLQNGYAGLHERDEGQALVEYALILALVSLAAVVALTTLGGKISGVFNSINSQLP